MNREEKGNTWAFLETGVSKSGKSCMELVFRDYKASM
jgi:hypothetical protein